MHIKAIISQSIAVEVKVKLHMTAVTTNIAAKREVGKLLLSIDHIIVKS